MSHYADAIKTLLAEKIKPKTVAILHENSLFGTKGAKSFKNTEIKQALSETDMMTVFGPVKFTTWGKMKNQNKAATYVVQWLDGKLELVWPTDHAIKAFAYPVDWMKIWGY